MIQIGWVVSDSLVILYVKAKIAIKWWLNYALSKNVI